MPAIADESPFSYPAHDQCPFGKVAILFAGGPAPAANAVISTAAASFLRNGCQVIGIKHGYLHLVKYAQGQTFEEGKHFLSLNSKVLKRTRNSQGILIGTSRTNPGAEISHPDHFRDPERVKPLRAVHEALCKLEVDALVSIGGDDTLKSANKFKLFQEHLPLGSKHIPVVHLPKTIDNDYKGIDFTFGYFTAVDTLAGEIRNLLADAEASGMYFLVETMGRSAGWLAYGAAIAGEASLVISVEDIVGAYRTTETAADPRTKEPVVRDIMNMDGVMRRIIRTIEVREQRDGKESGVIVVAEGLAELLPAKYLEGIPRDEYGHLSNSRVNLARILAEELQKSYKALTGRERKITGLQFGYEARCARPHAFDVMLGSQLGVGAYRALVEKRLDGVMVSVSGQLDLNYVQFNDLINPDTLVTVVRYVDPKGDFHKLARFLETDVNK
jgi:6-phosphofructokinase 1